MGAKKSISNSFTVNTVEDGEMYSVEWSDAFGVINNIICYNNGWAKYKPNGGAGEWIRATLYHREGSGVSQAVQCYEIYLRAYLSDGTQVTGSGWPKHVYITNHIALEGYDEDTSHVSYKAEFYDLNHNFIGTYSIGKTLDGASAPEYNKEYYAWSNQVSTSGVGVEPSIEGSWSSSIPQQHTSANLWKKIVHYTFDIYTMSYTADSPQYYRMNGENGTSIRTKGSVFAVVKYWVNSQSALPTSGETIGTLAWEDGTNYLLEYHETSTGWWAQSVTLHDGDRVLFYDPNLNASARKKVYEFEDDDFAIIGNIDVYDGDAYTEQQEGHLWQWSDEAVTWLDLGQFKGEAGATYYTHVAWADNVTFRSTPLEPAQGCLNKRNASSVSGGTTTPPTSSSPSKPFMGIRIDTIAGADNTVYTTYTWEKVQGAQGERGKTGKFYYYGGVFDPNNSTTPFIVNDANTPYFKYTSGVETHFWVYVKEVAEGNYTMSQMGTPSSSNADWKIMTDDFKYIISEAVFASFAHLGGFIMSDPWMISQTPTSDSPSQNISDFHGDPLNDDFRPMFAVNGQTGAAYMQNGYFNGSVTLKTLTQSEYRVTGTSSESSPVQIPLSTYPASTYVVSGVVSLPNAANFVGRQINLFFVSNTTLLCYQYQGANYGNVLFCGYDTSNPTPINTNLTPYRITGSFVVLTLVATTTFATNYAQWVVIAQRGIAGGTYMNTNYRIFPDGHIQQA